MRRPVVAAAALGVLLAGCTLPQPPSTTYDAARARRPPACARVTRALPLPRDFPPAFPLPAGTVVVETHRRPDRSTLLTAYIASRDFGETVAFFEDYLPLAGFAVTKLRTADPAVVSDSFAGHGHAGVLALYRYPGAVCPSEVILSASARPGNTPPVETY